MWNLDYVRTLFGCGNYISIGIHKIARVACNGSILNRLILGDWVGKHIVVDKINKRALN